MDSPCPDPLPCAARLNGPATHSVRVGHAPPSRERSRVEGLRAPAVQVAGRAVHSPTQRDRWSLVLRLRLGRNDRVLGRVRVLDVVRLSRATREEMLAYRLGLIGSEHPSCSLRLNRAGERRAQERANDLAVQTEFARKRLGPVRFRCIRHRSNIHHGRSSVKRSSVPRSSVRASASARSFDVEMYDAKYLDVERSSARVRTRDNVRALSIVTTFAPPCRPPLGTSMVSPRSRSDPRTFLSNRLHPHPVGCLLGPQEGVAA